MSLKESASLNPALFDANSNNFVVGKFSLMDHHGAQRGRIFLWLQYG